MPVCVYNNTRGDGDAAVRQAFEEPAWNNPVVRIVDPTSKTARDVVPRLANDWSLAGLTSTLVAALEARTQPVPPYLRLLAAETDARKRGVEHAAFGMT